MAMTRKRILSVPLAFYSIPRKIISFSTLSSLTILTSWVSYNQELDSIYEKGITDKRSIQK